MSFQKKAEQDNVLDGTVLVVDQRPGAGAYVTILGRGDQVYIVAFDLEDLGHLAETYEAVKS